MTALTAHLTPLDSIPSSVQSLCQKCSYILCNFWEIIHNFLFFEWLKKLRLGSGTQALSGSLRLTQAHSGSLRLLLRLLLSDSDPEPGLTLKSCRPPPLPTHPTTFIIIRLVLLSYFTPLVSADWSHQLFAAAAAEGIAQGPRNIVLFLIYTKFAGDFPGGEICPVRATSTSVLLTHLVWKYENFIEKY